MDAQTVLREIITGLMSVVICTGAVYSVLAGRPDGVLLDTMTGAVLSFYFTRGAVQIGQAGSKEAHQDGANTAVEAVKAGATTAGGHTEPST